MGSEDEQAGPQERDSSHLTKSERRELRKQQRIENVEEERARRKKKRIIKKIVILAAIILIVVSYIGFKNYSLKDAPVMQITPTSYDFGSVSVAEGAVSTTMEVENQGKNNLVIDEMKSTCDCTSASLTVDGIESPAFGMHDTKTGWSAILKPGQKAKLKVNYNPKVHMDLRGAVTRNVIIFSNDPKNKAKQVRIDAYQVD